MKDEIAALLAHGLRPADVSRQLGVSESYISQLQKDKEFMQRVGELASSRAQRAIEHDEKLDRIEDGLIDKMTTILPYILKPGEILKALQVVNGLKRKHQDIGVSGESAEMVKVSLPAHFLKSLNVQIELDSLGNVREVDGRRMETIDATYAKLPQF